ncbi:META domain-containing protein [Rubrivirga sp. IMCC43871]|uniref:META domain-containing protein n=1 Tax=Rubrivirga sp. IMCC43871 TaxID=3391575 RepID=UPI00399031FA
MRLALLLAVLGTAALAACSPSAPVGIAAEVPGTTWSLERIVTADGDVVRAEPAEISFGPEGSLAIQSCNACSGRYAAQDSVLTIDGPLACTKKACPAGALELERHVMGASVMRREGLYLTVLPADSTVDQLLFVPAQ